MQSNNRNSNRFPLTPLTAPSLPVPLWSTRFRRGMSRPATCSGIQGSMQNPPPPAPGCPAPGRSRPGLPPPQPQRDPRRQTRHLYRNFAGNQFASIVKPMFLISFHIEIGPFSVLISRNLTPGFISHASKEKCQKEDNPGIRSLWHT